MIAGFDLASALNWHQGRQLYCVNKDHVGIGEAALLFMIHSLIDYNEPNMNKHC